MGYTTDFSGEFTIDKPVDEETYKLLNGLNRTRRMKRSVPELAKRLKITTAACKKLYGTDGEFWIEGIDNSGQAKTPDILKYNDPPATQPGLWNQWCILEDAQTLAWDEGEKFYNYIEWITYLIDRILKPRGYTVSGEVSWHGEEDDDQGIIEVIDNVVRVKEAVTFYAYAEDVPRLTKLVNTYIKDPLKEMMDDVLDR
jgi:hypothetical protein